MSQRWRSEKPESDEFASFYAGYVDEATGNDIVQTLEKQGAEMSAFFRGIPEERGNYRYAEGKWSIKDIVLHLCDAERVFSYRLMRFARGDASALPGFDENTYAKTANADAQTLAQLADELEAVRKATVALVKPMNDEAMARRGTASGKEISARALAWILAGHVAHHVRVVRERYLETAAR